MQEIKFIDSISDVDNFLRLYSNIAKKDHQQEEKQMSYQALFLKSNEYLTSLNGIFSKLENYSETQEFIELINPIQMKIRYYVDNLNLLSGKFMIFLQKGNDENDQSCLECLEEGEKLINASYIIINKSFDEKVMKAIGRSHVENEDIFKETKKALDLLFNLKNNHENICTEEYICSLVLKKKVENNLTKIKSLIINLKSLLLAISNCTFFNISHINKIMQINYSIISEKSNEIKKTEKLRKILDHIKEFEQFLNINRNYIMEKVNKLIKERVNIEVKFYNYFLFMDEMNMKIANIYQSFQINEFSIILFDNPFLEKIENLCHLLEDIDINSQQILNLHYEENVILEKIKENINTWKNNIQNMLYFDDKSIQVLRNKLKIIFSIKNEENSILREINGIFSACEKTPKKRKKDTMEKEILIEKFFNEVNAFAELISEAQVAKNYIFGYRQKVKLIEK